MYLYMRNQDWSKKLIGRTRISQIHIKTSVSKVYEMLPTPLH